MRFRGLRASASQRFGVWPFRGLWFCFVKISGLGPCHALGLAFVGLDLPLKLFLGCSSTRRSQQVHVCVLLPPAKFFTVPCLLYARPCGPGNGANAGHKVHEIRNCRLRCTVEYAGRSALRVAGVYKAGLESAGASRRPPWRTCLVARSSSRKEALKGENPTADFVG